MDLKCKSLVIKVASRCNLNCTYCYMYNMGDETYKGQPKVMPDHVVDAMIEKVQSHCKRHDLEEFFFEFHGGEPLLAGEDFFDNFVKKAQFALSSIGVKSRFGMQTNGMLITPEWCNVLNENKISIGVSLDGIREDNDRYRIDHAGRGSYDSIVKGLKTAQELLKMKPSALSVININADPVSTYEHFKSLGIGSVNFLIPDCTYDQPPPKPSKYQQQEDETYYADWLIRIFDKWFDEGEEQLKVRIFDHIVKTILGLSMPSDSLGSLNNEFLVIETDGGIEALDVLKICGNGFTKAYVNIVTHELDDALQTDLARQFYFSHSELCGQCLKCPVKDICGGGYLPHRYKEENGFDNPSYYCMDLLKLITYIQNKILERMPAELLEEADISPLTFEQARILLKENAAEPSDCLL